MHSTSQRTVRVGIAHERFTDVAGSEHVVEQLAWVWPDAPVLVPFARKSGIPDINPARVRTSALQRVYPVLKGRSYAPLLPAVPAALRAVVAREHRASPLDALVISHHAFAVAAAQRDIPSLAYVHSPARWAWDRKFLKGETDSRAGQAALRVLGTLARRNEKKHVGRLDAIVANSGAVRQRIRDWWGRDAEIIHPPVDVEYFTPGPDSPARGDYFISVGRLVPYKRVDIAARAAVRAGVKIVIVGEGRDSGRVSAIAQQHPELVDMRGFLPTAEVRSLIQGARGLLMPGEEDFGIVPVEATACATPVIALAKGGALDSVVDGETGVLVPEGTSEEETVANFADAMAAFGADRFDRSRLLEHAAGFSRAEFRRKMELAVSALL